MFDDKKERPNTSSYATGSGEQRETLNKALLDLMQNSRKMSAEEIQSECQSLVEHYGFIKFRDAFDEILIHDKKKSNQNLDGKRIINEFIVSNMADTFSHIALDGARVLAKGLLTAFDPLKTSAPLTETLDKASAQKANDTVQMVSSKVDTVISTNSKDWISYGNKLEEFITKDILSQKSTEQRTLLLERYTLIAERLHESGRWFAAWPVVSALTNARIWKLEQTREGLSERAKTILDEYRDSENDFYGRPRNPESQNEYCEEHNTFFPPAMIGTKLIQFEQYKTDLSRQLNKEQIEKFQGLYKAILELCDEYSKDCETILSTQLPQNNQTLFSEIDNGLSLDFIDKACESEHYKEAVDKSWQKMKQKMRHYVETDYAEDVPGFFEGKEFQTMMLTKGTGEREAKETYILQMIEQLNKSDSPSKIIRNLICILHHEEQKLEKQIREAPAEDKSRFEHFRESCNSLKSRLIQVVAPSRASPSTEMEQQQSGNPPKSGSS